MFKENRVNARKIFHRVGKASNYLDCGIKNFVQEILLDNKANNLRVGLKVWLVLSLGKTAWRVHGRWGPDRVWAQIPQSHLRRAQQDDRSDILPEGSELTRDGICRRCKWKKTAVTNFPSWKIASETKFLGITWRSETVLKGRGSSTCGKRIRNRWIQFHAGAGNILFPLELPLKRRETAERTPWRKK